MMKSLSDADRIGFYAADIYEFLDGFDVRLNRTARTEKPKLVQDQPRDRPALFSAGPMSFGEFVMAAAEAMPDWRRPLVGLNRLSLARAAAILARIGAGLPEKLSAADFSEYKIWRDALQDAIDNDEIDASTWSMDRDNEQMLSHRDIRQWCTSRGHNWPIPEPAPIQQPSRLPTYVTAHPAEILPGAKNLAELELKLVKAEEENARLLKLVPPRPRHLMEIAIAVQQRYWGGNWDELNRDSWPKATHIIEWISREYPGLSEAERKAVERVACPLKRGSTSEKQR